MNRINTMVLLREVTEEIKKEQDRNERRIRCNNTNCGCYKYGYCSSESVTITWNDKRNLHELICDFNR